MFRANTDSQSLRAAWEERSAVKLLDHIFVLRPTLMFPLLTMFLAGHRLAGERELIQWQQWLLIVAGLCALFGILYLLNQLRDVESDRRNGKLFLIAEGALGRRQLTVELILLVVVALVALAAAGFMELVLLAAAMFLVGGVLYNFTPAALQMRPWGGVLAGLVGGWLLLRGGEIVAGGSGALLGKFPYLIAFASACLLTDLLDREGDEASGKRSFAVVYGEVETMAVALVGFAATALGGLLLSDWVIALPATVSTPILYVAWRRGEVSLAVTANKVAIFALTLSVGLSYPLYLVSVALYYFIARWYYQRRFGIVYPSFRGV